MDQKTGVFICEGCGIGDALELDRLESVAGNYNVPHYQCMGSLCSDEGVDAIKSVIESESLTDVVLGGCSPRQMVPRFAFDNVKVERVNLREGVVWSHNPEVLEEEFEEEEAEENVNMMAEDYLRMALVKIRETKPFEPELVESTKRVLVIGGGVSGMAAALNVAKTGYEAVIAEKADALGGWAAKFATATSDAPAFTRAGDPKVAELIESVNGNDKITVHTGCTVASVAGAPGAYKVELSNGTNIDIGSVIVSVGWKPFDTSKFDPKYGLGENEKVVTSIQFEEMIKEGKISDLTSVAFVTNPDITDGDQSAYLGNVADIVALKQAHLVKQASEIATCYLIHDHVKSPGLYEDIFRTVQEEGLVLIRGKVESIGQGMEKPLGIVGTDILLGTEVEMDADLLVLSVGMVPASVDEQVLNLKYRQGPELPELTNGYPNSHFICFPYETRRTGVYTCGTVREPMVAPRCYDDAAGAALNAIKVLELSSKGQAMLPRVGDMLVPDFSLQRCTQCKRCTEECPFGALDEDEKGTPKYNPSRCRRCGTCMGACPERIINFPDFSVGMVGRMIKEIEVPDEFEEKPRVLMLVCENDAYPALDMAAQNKLQYSSFVRVLPIRCLGSVNLVWIADSLSKGFDGIMLLGCKHGDDYQCHFVKGSELANTRMEKVSETLERLMLEPERIYFQEINITDYKEVPGMINDFVERLVEMGPNPYKE